MPLKSLQRILSSGDLPENASAIGHPSILRLIESERKDHQLLSAQFNTYSNIFAKASYETNEVHSLHPYICIHYASFLDLSNTVTL